MIESVFIQLFLRLSQKLSRGGPSFMALSFIAPFITKKLKPLLKTYEKLNQQITFRFLQELSETLGNQTHHLEDQQKKYSVCATIRLLGKQ